LVGKPSACRKAGGINQKQKLGVGLNSTY